MGQIALDMAALLKSSATETLENLAFTELDSAPNPTLEQGSARLQGAVIDLGTLGRMELILEQSLLEGVAEVLFNPPPGSLDTETITDTLKEILNIIAGRFLGSLFQGKSDFVMGLPEPHLDVAAWNTLRIRTLLISPEGGFLAVGLDANGITE
jgi:hypothetical protein